MKKKGKATINETLCKGCGICAHYCPSKIITIINSKAVITNPNECIACMMCELRCPDFAIYVDQINEPSKTKSEEN